MWKIQNKTIFGAVFMCLMVLLSTSCAHKSGHKKKTNTTTSRINKEERIRKNKPSVEVADRRRSNIKLEPTEIFRNYNSAVFMVFTTDGYNKYQGSGFFISDDGIAVSNYHVFEGTTIGAEAIKLVGSNIAYKVEEVYVASEDDDFILFKVDCGDTNFIPIAKKKPEIGEKVFALGSPRGMENTFSSGEVSQWRDTNVMQISVQIDHGSSGGALINEFGEVVGITTGTFYDGSQANLNRAISIDVIKPYI